MVAEILGAHERRLTQGFLQLTSHYLFDTHFCQVRRANEKGVVESMVKYARLNFMVPVPQVRDLKELNERLKSQCYEERNTNTLINALDRRADDLWAEIVR